VTPLNRLFHTGAAGFAYNPNLPMGLSAINNELIRQAQIVAYSNDFMFMFWLSLPTALALLIMRKPQHVEPVRLEDAVVE
jgi:DHA2 family multidrug resistance protein